MLYHVINDLLVVQISPVLFASLSFPFYFVAHFTNKQHIFIVTSKCGPLTPGLSEKPQIEIHVQKSGDEIIPEDKRF